MFVMNKGKFTKLKKNKGKVIIAYQSMDKNTITLFRGFSQYSHAVMLSFFILMSLLIRTGLMCHRSTWSIIAPFFGSDITSLRASSSSGLTHHCTYATSSRFSVRCSCCLPVFPDRLLWGPLDRLPPCALHFCPTGCHP